MMEPTEGCERDAEAGAPDPRRPAEGEASGDPATAADHSPFPDPAARFARLVEIIDALRSPNGCPWDREQTHASLRPYLLEEAYETIEAIESGDDDGFRDELGDVLLQIMLHSRIASEEGRFDIGGVIAGLSEKMVRRHPHVFGDVSVADSADVVRNWEAIKAAEKSGATPSASVLDGIPRAMPALARAMEVSRRAVAVGFEWERIDDVWAKLDEELSELRNAVEGRDADAIRDELGDLLFTIVNIARWLDVDPEESLRRMLDRFQSRFRHMESALAAQDRRMEETSLSDLDALWEQAKKA